MVANRKQLLASIDQLRAHVAGSAKLDPVVLKAVLRLVEIHWGRASR